MIPFFTNYTNSLQSLCSDLLLALTTLAVTSLYSESTCIQHSLMYGIMQELWRAVESVGIEVRVNEPNDCDPRITGMKVFGWYSGITREMVVCQEQVLSTGNVLVKEW